MAKRLLQSYDETSEPRAVAVKVAHDAESITIKPLGDDREILIETVNGELRIRCYDGQHDSPLTVALPRDGGINVDAGDYGK